MPDLPALHNRILLVVNTGSQKKRFILQKLNKLGLTIVLLNKDKNWAQPYVDYWILADTYNHQACLEAIHSFIDQHPELRPEGAITFWEDDIPLLAEICAEFELRGNSTQASHNTRSKLLMQQLLAECGEPSIPYQLLAEEKDLQIAMEKIGYPAVIKPIYGSDSQYVVYVTNKEEAEEAYEYVRKNCTPEFDPIYKYNQSQFVYQAYIAGSEFSVEGYCQHGIPHVVGIHEKTKMDLPFFMETGEYLPARVSKEQAEELAESAKSALIVLGVKDSLFHAEIKLTKKGPQVIEIASRMGGDNIYGQIDKIYDFDLIEAGCEVALGINVNKQPKEAKKCAVNHYFIPKVSGVITRITGFDEATKAKEITEHFLAKEVGDKVLVPPLGYDNIGWVVAVGNTYAEAENALANLLEKVQIEVAPFRTYSSFGQTKRNSRFSAAQLQLSPEMAGMGKIEKITKVALKDIRKLHVGIAANDYIPGKGSEVEKSLMDVGHTIEKTLKNLGYRTTYFDFNNWPNTFQELQKSDVDIIFNVCERINNSSLLEPHAAAIFDSLQIPYTGSNPITLGLCIDKIRVKKLLAFHNIPTPRWDYAYSMQDKIREDLTYPLIVKPAETDNSIGVTNDSVVTNKKDLEKQMKYVLEELKSPVLVEEYIEGDEYDLSIIGNDAADLRVLPLSRTVFKDMPKDLWHIYSYESKWEEGAKEKQKLIVQRPAKNISKKLEVLLSEIGLDTYNILDCHDYGRIEIRVDDEDNPYVLELNPNPSINQGDCVPEVANLAGLDYGEFIEQVIRMAIKRYQDQPPYAHLQTSLL